jgi:glyoxylase-like metal-dependent hydrolase (beta-lactamase superfamily II)
MLEHPPVPLTQNLWALGSAAHPVYVFLQGDEGILFEGGIGSTAPLLLEQMDHVGIARERIRCLAVTHAHPDHVMAVNQLRKAIAGLKIVASEKAAQTLASEKAVGFFAQMDQALLASLAEKGAIREEHCPSPTDEKQIAVDRVVGEGDCLAVGTSSFQVLATPGHSDCSLSFYEPQAKILVISDATGYYMPQDGTWWPNYFAGYRAYVESMERLAELPAEVLCLSHNAAIRGAEAVRDYFTAALAATRKYHERIVAEAKAGRSVREIAEMLGGEIHRIVGMMPLEFFQKNCGILVKMSLKHEGVV